MDQTFTLREIADAVAAWSGRASLPGDGTFQRVKSLAQAGALIGSKPLGGGRTAARRYDLGEACFAGLLTILGDFITAGQHGVAMRDGFFVPALPRILESIRNGDEWTATLRFGQDLPSGPVVQLALHRNDEAADWSAYATGSRPSRVLPDAQILFDAPWKISSELRSLLFTLEENDK